MRTAWRSRSVLYGPQLAGWETQIADGGPPSRPATSSTTERSSRAISASAEYGTPPSRIGVVSPRRRLNSRATRCGSVSAAAVRRLAGQERLVLAQQHDRRDGRRPAAERGDLRVAVAPGRRGGVGGAEVDAECVHRGCSGARGIRVVTCRRRQIGEATGGVGGCPRAGPAPACSYSRDMATARPLRDVFADLIGDEPPRRATDPAALLSRPGHAGLPGRSGRRGDRQLRGHRAGRGGRAPGAVRDGPQRGARRRPGGRRREPARRADGLDAARAAGRTSPAGLDEARPDARRRRRGRHPASSTTAPAGDPSTSASTSATRRPTRRPRPRTRRDGLATPLRRADDAGSTDDPERIPPGWTTRRRAGLGARPTTGSPTWPTTTGRPGRRRRLTTRRRSRTSRRGRRA